MVCSRCPSRNGDRGRQEHTIQTPSNKGECVRWLQDERQREGAVLCHLSMSIEAREWTHVDTIDAVMRLVEFGSIQGFVSPFKRQRCGKRNCMCDEQSLIRCFEVIGNHLQLVGVEIDHVSSAQETSRAICNRPCVESKRTRKSVGSNDTRSGGGRCG